MKISKSIKAAFLCCGIIFSSCQTEQYLSQDNRMLAIDEAKWFYESLAPEISKTQERDSLKNVSQLMLRLKPVWEESFREENTIYRAVETLMNADDGRVNIYSGENYMKYEETGDRRYLLTMTRLVYLVDKRTKEKICFMMTIIPSPQYQEETGFKPFHNAYIKRDKNYSGAILFHNVDGTRANGWRYEKGKIIEKIRPVNR